MTCRDYLLRYLQNNPGWHRKGTLYNVVDEEGYSPETGARELRAMAEEKLIFVEYYKGKKNQRLAKYSANENNIKKPFELRYDPERRVMVRV